jgi:hypothetical protein
LGPCCINNIICVCLVYYSMACVLDVLGFCVTFCFCDSVKQWRMRQLTSPVRHPLRCSHQYTWAAGHKKKADLCSLISATTLEKCPVITPFVTMDKQIQTFFLFTSIILKISFTDVFLGGSWFSVRSWQEPEFEDCIHVNHALDCSRSHAELDGFVGLDHLDVFGLYPNTRFLLLCVG